MLKRVWNFSLFALSVNINFIPAKNTRNWNNEQNMKLKWFQTISHEMKSIIINMYDRFDAVIPQKHLLTFIECDKSIGLSLHQWMKYALMVFLATLMEFLQNHSDEWAKFSIRYHVSGSTASLHLWSEKFMTTDGRRYTFSTNVWSALLRLAFVPKSEIDTKSSDSEKCMSI